MVAMEGPFALQRPIARKAAATVLLPGARIVPASSTRACWKTPLEKSGAKGVEIRIMAIGRVCTRHLFFCGLR
jgi:hypothetical protein